MCCRYYFDNDTLEDIRQLTGRAGLWTAEQTDQPQSSQPQPAQPQSSQPQPAQPQSSQPQPARPQSSQPQPRQCRENPAAISRTDVHPDDQALILTGRPGSHFSLQPIQMRWGFKSRDNKLLINARSESALQKKTFAESTRRRRCIIPAAGFYEWDAEKNKADFTTTDHSTMYMAGIYDLCNNEPCFTILTTAANNSMAPVHDRMPLILKKEQIRSWIYEDAMTEDYLKQQPEELDSRREYEQLTLF